MIGYSPITGVDVKITNKCMLSCDFCVNNDGLKNTAFVNIEKLQLAIHELLTAPKDLAVLDAIYFTGGETLYGLEIIKKIIRNIPSSIFTSVVTNGLMLNNNIINNLVELNLNRVKVSYDTTDSVLLVDIRKGMRINGLEKIEKNIISCVKAGLLVYLRVALTKLNAPNLLKIYEKAVELGVDTLQIKPVISSGRAYENNELILSSKDLHELFHTLSTIYDEKKLKVSISCFPPANSMGFPVKNCANRDKLYLEVNGDIYTCNYVVEKFNYLGSFSHSGGINKALTNRLTRFHELFNDDGVISNCPSIKNYEVQEQ